MILMGLVLLLVAWRLVRHHSGWPCRVLMAGALLLALGYGLVLPLYDAGVVVPFKFLNYYPQADAGTTLGWHLTKLLAMNGGWFLFGLGLAMHAGVFQSLRSPAPSSLPTPS